MQKVAIIGLGLIGGSIGLGLKRWSSNEGKRENVLQVTGFDLELEHQNYAKKAKAVDKTVWSLPGAVANADFVVIAVPPLAIRDVMESIGPALKPGAVVCDVASTKVDVMRWADELLPDTAHFVGSHPMAGGSLSIEAAKADLFEGSTWCVVPSIKADEGAVQTVLGMISALQAEPMFVDAHEHDGFVGGVSHLPFILSTAMTSAVSRDPSWRDMKQLSATGFRDVSRLAGGSAEMHRDICVTNRDAVTRWIDEVVSELQEMRALIHVSSEETSESLLKVFEDARDARAAWSTSSRRDGRLVQETDDELVDISVGGQISQLIFGNLFRRRPKMNDDKRNGSKS